MRLKRLWDITNKKMVFVKGPTGHECQLWVDEATGNMYYYDMAQWLEYEQSAGNDGRTYGPTWETVDGDDDMGVYDTNNPTDLFTWESGDKVSYVFNDWDGTVLKEGKVDEGTAPTPPADPTREATAQYTYTFAGWNPTVGPISKKTVYTATYTSTVNEYTITWLDGDGNTLDTDTLEYGATPVYEGETPTKTATAQYTYTFNNTWSPAIATVTGNATYTAQFDSTPRNYTVTIGVSPEGAGTVDTQQVTVAYGTEISYTSNVLRIGDNEITATAGSGYDFSSWGTLPETVTGDLSITATFEHTAVQVSIRAKMSEVELDVGATITPSSVMLPIGEQYNISLNLPLQGDTGAQGTITVNSNTVQVVLDADYSLASGSTIAINDTEYWYTEGTGWNTTLPNIQAGDTIWIFTYQGAS